MTAPTEKEALEALDNLVTFTEVRDAGPVGRLTHTLRAFINQPRDRLLEIEAMLSSPFFEEICGGSDTRARFVQSIKRDVAEMLPRYIRHDRAQAALKLAMEALQRIADHFDQDGYKDGWKLLALEMADVSKKAINSIDEVMKGKDHV
jgi:hypothetical protein